MKIELQKVFPDFADLNALSPQEKLSADSEVANPQYKLAV
jgi:hypothetical protein